MDTSKSSTTAQVPRRANAANTSHTASSRTSRRRHEKVGLSLLTTLVRFHFDTSRCCIERRRRDAMLFGRLNHPFPSSRAETTEAYARNHKSSQHFLQVR